MFAPWKSESLQNVSIKRVSLRADRSRIGIYCNGALGQIAMRQEYIDQWSEQIRKLLGDDYKNTKVTLYSNDIPIERYISNIYRSATGRDPSRELLREGRPPLVRPINEFIYGQGLNNTHIALWAGHGRYFEEKDSAWKWQRPALFCSMEDLNTHELTTQYLAPMLENAGAVIIMPRERDHTPLEIIVDNDNIQSTNHKIETIGNWVAHNGGFAFSDVLEDQNPFTEGSHLQANISSNIKSNLTYTPQIAEPGNYGVYVSYHALPTNLTRATYSVYHMGGVKKFEVNQRIGGGTWIWLGHFELDKNSKIVLSTPDNIGSIANGATLTADAIKIGGGMGNIKRGFAKPNIKGSASISGLTRYAEAARYWMQYSGVVDSVYAQDTKSADNKTGKMLDYTDNYKGNGDWCNYLINRKKIPLDIAVGIHTDAGISDSSTIGTLSICFSNKTRNKYTNGKSCMAARDLADITQSQIVNDIRAIYDSLWTRRSIYDKSYAEISRPDVPSALFELLSHQNANDMALWLDPAVRFDIARAVYKGIVRFMADRSGRTYTIQPLAPSALSSELVGRDSLRIRWEETTDKLEPTAKARYFKLYSRVGEGAFDDGNILSLSGFNETTVYLPGDGLVHSYRVTAINDGGESFPSETIAAGKPSVVTNKGVALIVNGFTRVSAPHVRYETIQDSSAAGGSRVVAMGFDLDTDPGVPYMQERSIVGRQTIFDRTAKFIDNNNPGWGASSAELETRGVAGNNFDYIADHGAALLQLGYSFVGISRQAFENRPTIPSKYTLVDIIMGAQRSYPSRYCVYNNEIISVLRDLLQANIKVIISGAYIASDQSHNDESAKLLGYSLAHRDALSIPQPSDLYTITKVDILKGTTPLSKIVSFEGWPIGVQNSLVTALGTPIEAYGKTERIKLFESILK